MKDDFERIRAIFDGYFDMSDIVTEAHQDRALLLKEMSSNIIRYCPLLTFLGKDHLSRELFVIGNKLLEQSRHELTLAVNINEKCLSMLDKIEKNSTESVEGSLK